MIDIFACKFYYSKLVLSEPATLQRCTDTWYVLCKWTDGKISFLNPDLCLLFFLNAGMHKPYQLATADQLRSIAYFYCYICIVFGLTYERGCVPLD